MAFPLWGNWFKTDFLVRAERAKRIYEKNKFWYDIHEELHPEDVYDK